MEEKRALLRRVDFGEAIERIAGVVLAQHGGAVQQRSGDTAQD
jgi:hypothetical protein